MATVARFTVPAEKFSLGALFRGHPEVTVELERVVPTEPALVPYIWLDGLDTSELTEVLTAAKQEPAVREIRTVDEVNGSRLLRLEWEPETGGLLGAISNMNGTLVSGVGTVDSWVFKIRGDSHDSITSFRDYCNDHDIPLTLTAVHRLSSVDGEPEDGLTESQREALVLAYRRGYYRSPREVTLETLATELGISGQAFGARLRRGINRLIERTVIDTE